jgi:hypothetical protein
MIRFAAIAALATVFSPRPAMSQGHDSHTLAVQATPIGALPPIALPMPGSRNHSYWGFRLQTGRRTGGDASLSAIAGGVDLQYKGGSTLGLTAGYQSGDCGVGADDCNSHSMFGIRTRINLFTGGPTIAAAFGDASATSTLGTEVGFGYAPHILPGFSACAIDFGMPFSVAMLQRVRLVSYITPGVVWNVDCADEGTGSRASYLTGLGFGLQQLGHRGFDVYFGVQKIFLGETGYQFGISATYVLLPWGK